MLPDPIRTSPLTPAFNWDERVGQYRDIRTGRFLPRLAVREALETAIAQTRLDLRAVAAQLQGGQIGLAEFQLAGEQYIKRIHIAESAAARGGWAQMTQSDWGWVGQRVRTQYEYWRGFMDDIASGKQPLDGRFLRRLDMYANAGRATFEEMTRRMMRGKGMNYGKRNLGDAEHCRDSADRPGCIELAALGWVPIDEMVPIGNATCLVGCQCYLTYSVELPT